MNTLQGIIFSILIALGVVQMTPPAQEPILGADSTINRLELWTATTSPYAAITPRTYGRSLYLPTGSVTATYGYFTNIFADTCTGTGCGSGASTDNLFDVTNRGASATATLQLYGGFLASSSTVTSTFRVIGATTLATTTVEGKGICLNDGTYCPPSSGGASNANFWTYDGSGDFLSPVTSTTSVSSSHFIVFQDSNNQASLDATGFSLRVNGSETTIDDTGIVTVSDITVDGTSVCLSSGVNCPAGTGTPTLAQVSAQGSSATTTLQLYGGFLASSSTVTSTFYVVGNTTLTNATATTLFTTSLKGTSSTITTIAATSLFADQVTSTALFATSFKATSSTIATLAAGALFFGNGTSTNFFAAGTASSSLLFANMATLGGLVVSSTTVCLSSGVGCLAASASAAGIVELATIAETSAGSDATRAVTPDGLAGSVFGSKTVELYLTTSTGALLAVNSASNTSTCFTVQPPLAGMVLTAAHVAHGVAGSGTTSTVVNIKTTSSLFLLSTPLYIDPGEYGSETAVTSSVINTSNDDVWAYERLCAVVQNVENTTPGKETILSLTFSLP